MKKEEIIKEFRDLWDRDGEIYEILLGFWLDALSNQKDQILAVIEEEKERIFNNPNFYTDYADTFEALVGIVKKIKKL